MSIKTYSLVKDGNTNLSKNFKVREFRCKDGTDKILIDSDLIDILQKLRNKFGKSITINSAYRTTTHNKLVGGATNSQHLKGTAADIVVSGISLEEVSKACEEIGAGGIGKYENKNFVHVDTRANKYYWIQKSTGATQVNTFGGNTSSKTYHKVVKGDTVSALSKKYGVTIENIKSWNDLNDKYLIKVGQKLRVK